MHRSSGFEALLVLGMVAVLGLSALGCDDAECRDDDGDGFGAGCERGPDCDDQDRARSLRCDAGAPDCEATPAAEGCPCLSGAEVECYAAPSETLLVGACRAGLAHCAGGAYSSCEGAVLPSFERCNEQDDDCDGLVDEGVQSPCGGCDERCIGGVWGPPLSPFAAGGALDVTAVGELTLSRTARSADTLWVPNTDEGTVSKVDAVRAIEVARYRTAGGAPIAVAVDHRGDAYLLDRGGQGRSMLTKIAADRARCRAADGDSVSTSSGAGDVLPFGDDGCVLFGVAVGEAGDDARALAVDGALAPDDTPAGRVWVGLSAAQRLVQIDGETGAEQRSLELPGFSPLAAAFDPWGAWLAIDRAGLIARVETWRASPSVTVEPVALSCYELDALAIDSQGRAVITGSGCERVITYEPRTGRFAERQTPDLLTPRGLALRDDEAWVSFSSGQLGRLEPFPLRFVDTYPLAKNGLTPYDALAVAVDEVGLVWMASALGGKDGRGLLTAFDPVREEVRAQVTVGRGPHGLGDMTGLALGGVFAREGQASHVFTGCGHESSARDAGTSGRPTRWQRVHVRAAVGPDAELEVEVRHAPSAAELDAAAYATLGILPQDTSPLPLELPEGGAVEVRVTLRSRGAIGAPRLEGLGVQWECPGPD